MEIMSIIVLVLCCVIALVRPVWGIAILLIFKCSLFRLDRYVTVPLGIGYAGPGDVLIFGILIGGRWYCHRRQRRRSTYSHCRLQAMSRWLNRPVLNQ